MKIEKLIEKLSIEIGENPGRTGLKDTPRRVAKMYKEMFGGYKRYRKPIITTFPNGEDGVKQDQMVIDKGYFYSQCEHHMIPFFGEYAFAYIPDERIAGISKISRLIDWHSARLQVQERLTQQIVEDFEKELKPSRVMLVMKARHLCKEMRGTKKYNSPMITSCVRGVFKEQIQTREEFLKLIQI